MRILLLSAYDTDSHKSWCQGLISHLPQHQWCYLTLPGRFFSWRIRGNPLSFVYGEQAAKLQQPFDLIIATSMVDLATLKGLVPNLANTPSMMYFHENQFAYPKSAQQHASIEPQMVNLYSALSADCVVFNSHYNQHSFLSGISDLFKRLPDHAPMNAIDSIKVKSNVLPVPIYTRQQTPTQHFNAGDILKVIWNHRWEYDKGPETLVNVIKLAHQQQLNIEFTICGMSFRSVPKGFEELQTTAMTNVKHMGTFESKKEYLAQLAQHHVVLSTAHHEFQGLAVLEGAAYGCVPLAPNRLAYPEWIPDSSLYDGDDMSNEAHSILQRLIDWQQQGLPPLVDVCHYDWQALSPEYEAMLTQVSAPHLIP
ncbi:MAG: glycosyltransferase involved in cell wall biosynthesis [Oceanicoccus sp.]|jgi:glycosyltransferase involved in cell wall biosynthesis